MARAGVPLELGLGGHGGGALGGRLSRRLGDRLATGMSLQDAFAGLSGRAPDALAAALGAGVRAGDPAAALAGVARHAALVRSLRRDLRAAAFAPLAAVIVAAFLACWLLPIAAHIAGPLFRQADAPVPLPVRAGEWVFEEGGDYAALAPFGVTLVVGLGLWLCGERLAGWVPGVSAVRRHLRWATASQLLALLTGAGVPLPEAVRLAAGAVGGRGGRALREAADRLGDGRERAAVFAESHLGGSLPPLPRWALATADADSLPAVLAAAAGHHARRARAAADRCRAVWPALAIALIGGGTLTAYVFGVLGPALDLLDALIRAGLGGG